MDVLDFIKPVLIISQCLGLIRYTVTKRRISTFKLSKLLCANSIVLIICLLATTLESIRRMCNQIRHHSFSVTPSLEELSFVFNLGVYFSFPLCCALTMLQIKSFCNVILQFENVSEILKDTKFKRLLKTSYLWLMTPITIVLLSSNVVVFITPVFLYDPVILMRVPIIFTEIATTVFSLHFMSCSTIIFCSYNSINSLLSDKRRRIISVKNIQDLREADDKLKDASEMINSLYGYVTYNVLFIFVGSISFLMATSLYNMRMRGNIFLCLWFISSLARVQGVITSSFVAGYQV